MSLVKCLTLTCDADGIMLPHGDYGPCPEWFGEYTDLHTATQLRKIAKNRGWTTMRIGGKIVDKCPECSEAGR